MNEIQRGALEVESTKERTGIFIGRLRDIGIGNPDGIPSMYAEASDEELRDIADEKAKNLRSVSESGTLACIDGRRCIRNLDGTEPAVRYRRVGGTAANYGVARNAEASVLDVLSDNDTLGHHIHVIDEHIGFDRAAHQGSCGGANGEIGDNEAICTNDNIMAATKLLMETPQVKEYLGVGYNKELGDRVRVAAGKTAQILREKQWDGQKYVNGVSEENPHGVEDLEVDYDDEKFHGHRENTLSIILGEETLADDDEFVWNLYITKVVAERLAGQRGSEGYQQVLIAEIAKHIAVANRLPGEGTPILLLAS